MNRIENEIPYEIIENIVTNVTNCVTNDETAIKLGLKSSINIDEIFVDSTCIKANIHFPVDWILLKDATRTLMLATHLIRKYCIKNRMEVDPLIFITRMNKLCIEMAQNYKKVDSKKKRKIVYRRMKRLNKTIENHAKLHLNKLEANWQKTELTEKQKNQIAGRINNVLDLLPEAVKQAHDRIIGERQVSNDKKILSLYDNNVSVIIRKKANAYTEFGNVLYLAENRDGYIVDFQLYKDSKGGDAKKLMRSLECIKNNFNTYPHSVTGDRGFWAIASNSFLVKKSIENFICPKPVHLLKEQLTDKKFCEHQKRRAQTEARIAIIKSCYSTGALRCKSYNGRKVHMAIGVLTHNLCLISKKIELNREELKQVA